MHKRWMGKRVGVLLGGISKEREISLRTGNAMGEALKGLGYTVEMIDVGLDVVDKIRATQIDVAVIALHGTHGEDGTIQGLLEFMRIPYTGAGVLGSAVAMDKTICKAVARDLGIPVARDQVFHATADSVDMFLQSLLLDFPVVVKPSREGSTIGMTIVEKESDLPAALQLAAGSDVKIMVEECVAGKEITVGFVAGQILPTIEIAPKSGFYDYEAKYTKGMTEYIIPAPLEPAVTDLLNEWTLQICRTLECRGMARADYMVRPDGTAAFLELNTIPGMTATSLVPKAAAHAGIDFATVCERVLDDAGLLGGML